ncbi:hypothetical protein [Pyruvatibacter mobilis]|uniref:hypothetical protein n=1 Tax=Pyruvatibacter mobilis TaxID=1712261 RepID=UPI003BAD71FA
MNASLANMESWQLGFAPLVPDWLLTAGTIAVVLLLVLALIRRGPGVWWRSIAYAALLVALLNPSALREEREPVTDVAVLAIDRSQSNRLADRGDRTEALAAAMRDRMDAQPGLELREVDVTDSLGLGTDDASGSTAGGTRLFSAIEDAIADVPPERIAGIVAITDGQIHDLAPRALATTGAPFHALLTGPDDEIDRTLTIEDAPRFSIVGETMTLKLRVDDAGAEDTTRIAQLEIRIDGEALPPVTVTTGRTEEIEIELEHGGENVIEIEAAPGPGELTLENNRAVVIANGIRDRLRVLLVSGEPHAGERTWRNLLKADPAVDLVHFTILRPPEKQDGTPINELSLIAFPTRELFSVKLNEFDLVIFDRYRRRGVLPVAYLKNIADYVDNGGALLMAAGPDFASPFSIFRTPLAGVLPAAPTGEVITGGYHPTVTDLGRRHPVTAGLPGADQSPPRWGRWFRLIDAEMATGENLMEGPGGKPLMVLDRVKEGRVAQLLSDHAWLWTRGYEGGGPQAEMLRRLAHWLMKEPDLEEEKLRASARGGTLTVTRQTMATETPPVTVTRPDGSTESLTLSEDSPGRFTGRMEIDQTGLYRLSDGIETAITAAGPLNPKEFADVRVTRTQVGGLVDETGGSTRFIEDETAPDIRRIRPGRTASGSGWIGLNANEEYAVRAVSEHTLIRPELALLIALGAFMLAWRREGR